MLARGIRFSIVAPARQTSRSLVPRSLALYSNARLFSASSVKMSGFKIIKTDKACPVAGPYSQATVVGNTIYVSGQIPADVKGNLPEGSLADKTRYCAENIKGIVEAAGSSMEKVFRVTVYLTDMAGFAEMNGEFEKHFISKPARTCIAVKQLPKNVDIEIEAIAVL